MMVRAELMHWKRVHHEITKSQALCAKEGAIRIWCSQSIER